MTDPHSYIGCKTQNSGLLTVFDNIDNYLSQVDSLVCSAACPCKLTNDKEFISDIDVYPVYSKWVTSPNATSINYQTCNVYLSNVTMDETNFINYYANIEKSLECSGFCRTTYYSNVTYSNMTMYKYSFTDVNR